MSKIFLTHSYAHSLVFILSMTGFIFIDKIEDTAETLWPAKPQHSYVLVSWRKIIAQKYRYLSSSYRILNA